MSKSMEIKSEDDYLLLSGIQHFQFCKRQWALIHIEQQWDENVRTIEGKLVHEKVDQPYLREKRKDVLVVRAMPICSHELRLTGVCDVVEFVGDPAGVQVHGSDRKYVPVPVEYKRGKPKTEDSDILQLVAQAMCLEEMLVCDVPMGFLYYHEIRNREKIEITEVLKDKVRDLVDEMHHYFAKRHTPTVKTGNHCKNCSLNNICLPGLMKKRSVKDYIERTINNEEVT